MSRTSFGFLLIHTEIVFKLVLYTCIYHFYFKLLFSILKNHHSSIFDMSIFTVYMHTHVPKGLPCKRTSTSRYTEHQVSELKKRFKSDPYIKGIEKEKMAKNLGITQKAIKDWFFSQRVRLKRGLANKYGNGTVETA